MGSAFMPLRVRCAARMSSATCEMEGPDPAPPDPVAPPLPGPAGPPVPPDPDEPPRCDAIMTKPIPSTMFAEAAATPAAMTASDTRDRTKPPTEYVRYPHTSPIAPIRP